MSEHKSRYELWLEEEERKNQPTKRCSKCGEVKPFSGYWKSRKAKDGMQSWCIECARRKRKFKNDFDRFWKYYWNTVEPVGGCIEWRGTITGAKKLPICWWNGHRGSVRRFVYQLAIGDLPDDMLVIATCRNKLCVRQSHLRMCTKDEVEAMRCNTLPYGMRHGRAKLIDADIPIIRDMYHSGASYTTIAKRFGVHHSTIGDIVNGKRWAHVQ